MSAEQAASVLREDLNSFVRAELERAFNEALDGEIEEGMGRGVRFEVVEAVSEASFVAFGKGRFHVSLLRIPEGDVEIDLHVQRGGIANATAKRKTRARIQYNSEDSALIVLAKVYEDYNRNARPARFMLEMSEEEKKEMGFIV